MVTGICNYKFPVIGRAGAHAQVKLNRVCKTIILNTIWGYATAIVIIKRTVVTRSGGSIAQGSPTIIKQPNAYGIPVWKNSNIGIVEEIGSTIGSARSGYKKAKRIIENRRLCSGRHIFRIFFRTENKAQRQRLTMRNNIKLQNTRVIGSAR